MRYFYLFYGILASIGFLFFVGSISAITSFGDYTFIAICTMFGAIIVCTFYISESIKDLKKDLTRISDNEKNH